MTQHRVAQTDVLQGYLRYKEDFEATIRRVLESGWYILGKEVESFEREFASYCSVPHIVGVANGTDAITLALRALGVKKGDVVFTVSHTAVATVAAVELAGAIPVLIDVDPETYTIDLDKLSAAIKLWKATRPTMRLHAVLAVHLYGHPCDVKGLRSICDEHSLFLIEDCAQAHGATVGDRPVGSFGHAAAFSFYPTKNLGAFGDGGAVAFAEDEPARKCRALREYGWRTRYLSDVPGMNSRLDELQAAILSIKLRYLDKEVHARRQLASKYDRAFADLLVTPSVRSGFQHAYHLYVVRTLHREHLRSFLAREGIGTGVHYPVPVHRQLAYAGRIESGPGGLEVTDRISQEILSLPMHPFMSDADAEAVISSVRAGLYAARQ